MEQIKEMMKLFKLTDSKGQTHDNYQWETGTTLVLPVKKAPRLCSGDVVHAYRNINLGLLFNPQHANYYPCRLWEAKGKIVVEDYGKVGCFTLTMGKELELPEWFVGRSRQKAHVAFAILCAESVFKYFEEKYPTDDRHRKAIMAAKEYLKNPSSAADFAVAHAASRAAHFAVARAARAARATDAAYFAHAASRAAHETNFSALADQAVKMVMG